MQQQENNNVNAENHDDEKFRRRTYIIDPRFQWKYTTIIVLLSTSVAAIMGAFLYRAYSENTRILEIDPRYASEIQRGDQIFLLYLIALVVIMAVSVGFWGILVTHRISGPLYILGRYFGILADGRYPDLRPLRKKDELVEFFNAFADALAAMKAREKARLRDIKRVNELVEKAVGGGDCEETLKTVNERLQKIEDELLYALGETESSDVE